MNRRVAGLIGTVFASLFMAVVMSGNAAAVPAPVKSVFGYGQLPMPANAIAGASSGMENSNSMESALSSDGRYLAFVSEADTLDPDVNPDATGVFRKDLTTGKVVLVSRETGRRGLSSTGRLRSLTISGNGRLVAFVTDSKLDPLDADDLYDAYLRDVTTGATTLLTPFTSTDVGSVSLSGDGAYATFDVQDSLLPEDTGTERDVYRMKLADGTIELVSQIPSGASGGDDYSGGASLSSDGRWVAFTSRANDLVTGFTEGNASYEGDVFARDMNTGTTYLVSSRWNSATTGGNGGSEEPVIAGAPSDLSELTVVYSSDATDVASPGIDSSTEPSIYMRSFDPPVQSAVLISQSSSGVNADSRAHTPSVSNDGTKVVFSTDAQNLGAPPGYYGVYLRNLSAGTTTLISARNSYAVNGVISADGQQAVWNEAGGITSESDPTLMYVFARSLPAGKIRIASRPAAKGPFVAPVAFFGYEDQPAKRISANGRFAVFTSYSSRLPGAKNNSAQVYRRDLQTGAVILISRKNGKTGAASTSDADGISISADGNRVAFITGAGLTADDGNSIRDVYVRDVSAGRTILVSRADGSNGAVGDAASSLAAISADGKHVAFVSEATNLPDANGSSQVFVRDLVANITTLVSRADGSGGALANDESEDISVNRNGNLVAFSTIATNLSADDASPDRDVYVRKVSAGKTTLVSRTPGLAGAKLSSASDDPVVSSDGTTVAFVATDDAAVPVMAPWSDDQIVTRSLATGENTLVSIDRTGQAGDMYSALPSISADGRIVAFATRAKNMLPGIPNPGNQSLIAVRDLRAAVTTGPPMFGETPLTGGADLPSLSDNGRCVAFLAEGHNKFTGPAGDYFTGYVFARAQGCQDPQLSVPKITKLKVLPKKVRAKKKARLSFNLNLAATVQVKIQQWKTRKHGKRPVWKTRGKLTVKNLLPGSRTVKLVGRLSPKKLRPGGFLVTVTAKSFAGKSKPVKKAFKIKR